MTIRQILAIKRNIQLSYRHLFLVCLAAQFMVISIVSYAQDCPPVTTQRCTSPAKKTYQITSFSKSANISSLTPGQATGGNPVVARRPNSSNPVVKKQLLINFLSLGIIGDSKINKNHYIDSAEVTIKLDPSYHDTDSDYIDEFVGGSFSLQRMLIPWFDPQNPQVPTTWNSLINGVTTAIDVNNPSDVPEADPFCVPDTAINLVNGKIPETAKWKIRDAVRNWRDGKPQYGIVISPGALNMDVRFHFSSTDPLPVTLTVEHCPAPYGDFDEDGDVDSADQLTFNHYWTGADTPSQSVVNYFTGDSDNDGDVDSADLLAFISNYTGAL